MKFKELPKFWKRMVIILAVWIGLMVVGFIGFQGFLTGMRAESAAARAAVRKPDSELIGTRFEIAREGKPSVELILHIPENNGGEKLPVIFNLHGGGFSLGDASEMDSQCAHWAEDWGAIIVSVNYTKADVKPISYGVQETVDTILYFARHAEEYNADITKFSTIGHSAGGYYAAKTAIALATQDFPLAAQILVCPWTSGLPSQVSSSVAPALFILGGADPISQRTPAYQQVLRNAGVAIEVKEYEGGTHPFISTPYPELSAGFTEEERAEFITDEQKALAVQAEQDIGDWLASLYQGIAPNN